MSIQAETVAKVISMLEAGPNQGRGQRVTTLDVADDVEKIA
ncbi:hypothetical protein SAMN04488573_1011798, partial [Bacillus sp. 5mfcol3.1]